MTMPMPPIANVVGVPLAPYVPPYGLTPNITPFTYRDGQTYLQILEGLRVYINQVVVPYVAENTSGLHEEFVTEVNRMIETVNEALAVQDAEVDQKIAELITYVNDAVETVITSSIEVQDPVVAALVNQPGSETRTALDALYVGDVSDDVIKTDADVAALVANDASATNIAIDAIIDPQLDPIASDVSDLNTLTETGRLSTLSLDATYASQSVEDTVETGRLSTEALNQMITDSVKVAAAGVGCKVHFSSPKIIHPATETAIAFDAELYDTSNMHDAVAFPTRITVPDAGGPGFYIAVGQVEWENTGGIKDIRKLAIKKNSYTSYIANISDDCAEPKFRMQIIAVDYLQPGDYVELLVYNGHTADDNIYPYVNSPTTAVAGYNTFELTKITPSIDDVNLQAMYEHFDALYNANHFTVNE